MTKINAGREANQERRLQRLTAPVSGTVQEITVTNIGEVTEVRKPLLAIVPDGEPLMVGALLLNRNAGGIRPGMNAAVKLETHPFTHYGVLDARMERVSPNATVDQHDQQRGLEFPGRLALSSMASPRVTPGMFATVEIVTGSRSVAESISSPVSRSLHEAGREREARQRPE